MRTLAEFKRRAQIGAIVRHKFILNGVIQGDSTRPISKTQSNAVAFRTADGQDSWLHFPPASEIEFKGGVMSITHSAVLTGANGEEFTRTREMTYEFI